MSEIGPKTSPSGETIINNKDYAFGLSIGKDFNRHYLEHSGGWAGYASHFMRFREERLTIAVLSNYDEAKSEKYAKKIAEVILGNSAKK